MTRRTKARLGTPEGFAIDGRFSFTVRPRYPEPPLYAALSLTASITGAASVRVYEEARLFLSEDVKNCHSLAGQDGCGLDLAMIADRMTSEQMTVTNAERRGEQARCRGHSQVRGNDVLVGTPRIAKRELKPTAGVGNRLEVSVRADI